MVFVAHEELLDVLDFFLQLHCDLVDLRTLHVVMINLVSSNELIDTFILVGHNQLMLSVVPFGKLVDHELLHCYYVNDVILGFDVVQDQNAQLIGNAAVIEVFKHEDH